MKIKYDAMLIKSIAIFSSITGAQVKDCFIDNFECLTYVVEQNEMGKAIGKNGNKAMMVERALNRKIKIVEFNPEALLFIQNLIYPLRVKEGKQEQKTVYLAALDLKTRGLLIGRNASNLRNTEEITKRYFDIDEIRVV